MIRQPSWTFVVAGILWIVGEVAFLELPMIRTHYQVGAVLNVVLVLLLSYVFRAPRIWSWVHPNDNTGKWHEVARPAYDRPDAEAKHTTPVISDWA